jgi:hypothetical protein
MMKSCGVVLETYHMVRDIQLPTLEDDDAVRRGPYGYVTLGIPEFVYTCRAVLTSLADALLVTLKKDLHTQGLVPVNYLDYAYYVTGPRILRLSCLRGCFVGQ